MDTIETQLSNTDQQQSNSNEQQSTNYNQENDQQLNINQLATNIVLESNNKMHFYSSNQDLTTYSNYDFSNINSNDSFYQIEIPVKINPHLMRQLTFSIENQVLNSQLINLLNLCYNLKILETRNVTKKMPVKKSINKYKIFTLEKLNIKLDHHLEYLLIDRRLWKDPVRKP